MTAPVHKSSREEPPSAIPAKVDGKTTAAACAVAAVLVLSLLPRYLLFPYDQEGDYKSIHNWYLFISMNGNFSALKYDFSNYNVTYLYLLAILSLFEAPALLAIKAISIFFDYLTAFFVYRCVRLKYRGKWGGTAPILAGLATLFVPSVFLNSSAWGQTDATYASCLVMSLYFLLARREKMACAAFGLAFSFKLQAIFFAPFFLWLLAVKAVRLRSLFLIPAVWLGLLLPAWLIGRPLDELLLIYWSQVGFYPFLSKGAPNLYAWIPNHLFHSFFAPGLTAAMIFVSVAAALLHMSRAKVTEDAIVLLATFSVLVTPYILPRMVQRYYFPADVISIILAFYFPRLWYVPVTIGLSSLLVYMPSLSGHRPVEPAVMALLLLLPIGVLGQELVRIFAGKTSGPPPCTMHPKGGQ